MDRFWVAEGHISVLLITLFLSFNNFLLNGWIFSVWSKCVWFTFGVSSSYPFIGNLNFRVQKMTYLIFSFLNLFKIFLFWNASNFSCFQKMTRNFFRRNYFFALFIIGLEFRFIVSVVIWPLFVGTMWIFLNLRMLGKT